MKTSQLSKPILWVASALLVFNLTIAINNYDKYTSSILICVIVITILFILFYKLDIQIDSKNINLKFGMGIIRKTFSLDSIASVKEVKNSPLLGWGIRFHPKFTLYNASGLSAIELSFKDGSRNVRIGADDPSKLASYISQLL